MEIKLKTFAEVLQATKEVKIEEKVTWDDASVAAHDIMRDLKSKNWKMFSINTNGFKVKHDNGCVGTVVFDPSLKESVDEINEAKINNMSKSEIAGEVQYLFPGVINSSDLSEYIDDIYAYLKTEYGSKTLDKSLAKKIAYKKV